MEPTQHIGGMTQKEYMARYYQNNREKIIQRAAKSRKENAARDRATRRLWVQKNPERERGYKRKWDKANKERKAAGDRRRAATPDGRLKNRAKTKKYRERHPGKDRGAKMDWHYRSKYGITVAERDRILEAQGKRCRICQTDKPKGRGFHVDHCHSTQKIRGILCHHCNLILGHSQDSVAILEAAIAYLKGSQ